MTTVAEALADMSKWEDVATELYVRGITGLPGNALSCPVAKYLAPFGDCCVVSDGENPADAEVSEYLRYGEVIHRLPANVNQFVGDFDANRHPELDARNVEN